MATLLGDAVIRVRPDMGNFQTETQSGVKRALGAIGGLAKGSLGVIAAAGAAASVSVIKTGVAYNDLEQKSKAAFTTILGSADAATKMMGDIREFGRSSPFPRQAFIAATQQMLGFGFAAEDVIPTLDVINDATAALGGNAETIATFTDVFAKIKSNGKITGEELNRLGAIGVDAVGILAEASGKTGEAIRKDISKGAVDAEFAIDALTKGMGKKFDGASENVKNTWGGAVDRVKGAWRDLSSAIVEPFISTGGGGMGVDFANKLADGLRKAANAAPAVLELLTKGNYTGALKDMLGWDEDGQAVDRILKFRDAVSGIFNLLAKGDYTGALQRAFGWEEDSRAVDALLSMRDAVRDLGGAIGALFSGDLEGVKASLSDMGSSLSGVLPVFKELGPAVSVASGALGGMAGDALKIIGSVMKFVADNADTIIKALPYLVAAWGAYVLVLQATNFALVRMRGAQILSSISTFASLRTTQAQTAALVANAAALNGVTIAEQRRMMAEAAANRVTIRSVLLGAKARVVLVATTIATAAATAAQWAFNAAIAAPLLPILAVIAGIGLLVGGIVLLWKKNETFRRIVTAAWEGIKNAFAAVVDWFKSGGVVDAFNAVWDGIVAGANWLWDALKSGAQVGVDVFDWIVDKAKAVWGAVSPVFSAIGGAFLDLGRGFMYVWDNWIFPVIDLFKTVGGLLARGAFALAVAGLKAIWQGLGDAVKWVWENVLSPVFKWFADGARWVADAVGTAITWLWEKAIQPALGFIQRAWILLTAVLKLYWESVLKPVFQAVGDAIMWVWEKVVSPVFQWIADKWNWLGDSLKLGWTVLKAVFDALMDIVEHKVKGAFERGVDAIGKAWDWIKDKAKEPVRFIIDTVINNGIVDTFNKIADLFPGVKHMSRIALPKGFASGGYTGSGHKYEPAGIVHKGEYVFTKEQTERIGAGRLSEIASNGYAKGGLVDTLKDRASDAYSNVKSAVSNVADALSDPGAFLKQAVDKVMALAGDTLGSPFGQLVSALPRKLIDMATSGLQKVMGDGASLEGANGPIGQAGPGGSGWKWQIATLRAAFPGLALNSGFRPGAITATGNKSYHSRGRAVDVPPRMDVFNWIRKNYGAATKELIFSPAGGAQLHNGKPHVYKGITKAMHYDHVHWAYDRGGLAQGKGMMPKATLAPERVLSPRQTEAFEDWMRGDKSSVKAEAPLVNNLTLVSSGDVRRDLQEANFQLRKIRRGGVYAGQ